VHVLILASACDREAARLRPIAPASRVRPAVPAPWHRPPRRRLLAALGL